MKQSTEISRGPDGGPMYTETDLNALIAEPFNAVTAVVFLFIALYWIWRLRGQYRKHLFLSISAPILAIGGIGGTIYHAFRASRLALFMDWMPIAILTLAAAIFFLMKLVNKWYWAVLYFIAYFGIASLNFNFVPRQYAINVNYASMGLFILIPLVGYLYRTQWKHARWVGLALGAFVLAIISRSTDTFGFLPMGTHFLWHTFGAIACHAMFIYFFKINDDKN